MDARRLQLQLANRLCWQKHAHELERSDKTLKAYLPTLRKWQTRRLESSFTRFLDNPGTRPAAEFFLSDLYGEADFMKRDEEAAKILPKMAKILPLNLLQAAIDAIELSVLSHALDMRMARSLAGQIKPGDALSERIYRNAYQDVGYPRLRRRQVDLVMDVGARLDAVVQKHGISRLLAASRLPARMLGLGHLQSFLERGFGAFSHLGGASYFLNEIHRQETAISRRLMSGAENPFDPPFS
jgi:hypothetical protein